MILKLGQFVVNPTARFLTPIINTFGFVFLQNFNIVFKHLLGFAIGDLLYDKAKKKVHKYLLFAAFSVNGPYDVKKGKFLNIKEGRANFKHFLEYFKTTLYYYDDYIYDDNIHVVVIALPEEYNETYDRFVEGKYSKMYKDNQIRMLFRDENNIAVLKKSPGYRNVFKEKIKEYFSVSDKEVVIDEDSELEIPPMKRTDWL